MAEPYEPDPNDFYALLDDIEIAARDARRIDDVRETVIDKLRNIRLESANAEDEDLIRWDGSLRNCLNNMVSQGMEQETIRELLDAAPKNVEDLQNCLDQIELEIGSR